MKTFIVCVSLIAGASALAIQEIDCKEILITTVEGNVRVTCKPPGSTPTPTPTPTPVPPPISGTIYEATPANFTALISPVSPVQPGDTVLLKAGTYLPGPRPDAPTNGYRSDLTGTSNAPIVIAPAPGERPIIDGKDCPYGSLAIYGAYTVWRDLEIANSNTSRTAQRGNGVDVYGAHITLYNLKVHDCGTGIGAWQSATETRIVGCQVWNNGWQGPAPDRGHGHGIYAQNDQGTKLIEGNLVWENYGMGIHLFGQSGEVKGFSIEDNFVWENGKPATPLDQDERNILIGGQNPSERITVKGNVAYHPVGMIAPNIFIGYRDGNKDAYIENNFFIGGQVLYWIDWKEGSFKNNILIGADRIVTLESSTPAFPAIPWTGQIYRSTQDAPFATQGQLPVKAYTFAEWQTASGYDAQGSTFTKAALSGQYPVVRYLDDRAQIAAVNFDRKQTMAVALDWPSQTKYIIARAGSAQTISGTYTGSIELKVEGAEFTVWVAKKETVGRRLIF